MTKDYFHSDSVGDADACRWLRAALAPQLQGFYQSGDIKGFWLAVVENEEEATEKFIPTDTLRLVAGCFPFLYLRVNYIEGHSETAAVQIILSGAGFELVA